MQAGKSEKEKSYLYKNLSPLDHRYYLANEDLFDDIGKYLSEEAAILYLVKVEAALLIAHLKYRNIFDADIEKAIHEMEASVKPSEVYQEEEKTQHNIRALVNVIKSKLPERIHQYVHLGATSADILDTANSLRIRDAVRRVVMPLLIDLLEHLVKLSLDEAETPQVGRTHGQHAIPITFGFALAEYVSRLGKSIILIEKLSADLRGKLAGAVGAYNSLSLLSTSPADFERDFLSNMAIQPSDHSTQLVEPEYLLRLLVEINICFGIVANLADDLRHLQRSEINEVREEFKKQQVGSSTMPQKRNPWNSEHVKSLWKAFSPRIMTMFMDQISEHQRDLTNSASARFIIDYLAGFAAAIARMKMVVSSLYVDRKRMLENMTARGESILAEPVYLLLALSGHPNAHEEVRRITLESERRKVSFKSLLRENQDLWNLLEKQLHDAASIDAETFFTRPELYRGKAAEKTLEIASVYQKELSRLREILA